MPDSLLNLGSEPFWNDVIDNYQNWTETPSLLPLLGRKVLEFEATATHIIKQIDDVPKSYKFKVSLFSLEEIYSFLDFVNARKGRLGRFWFPLPFNFFRLVGTQLNSTTELRTRSKGFDYKGYERIYIFLNDDTFISRKIKSVSEDGDDLLLGIDALTQNVEPEDVDRCSFLILGRLEVDELSMSYNHCSLAETNITIRELVAEYDDI